jgi:putative redox protein
MVTMTFEYLGELRTRARHEPSGTTLIMDAPVDNHGKGESFSPTDLVATGLGGCILTVIGIVAQRHNLDLRGTTAQVVKEMVTDGPRRIARLTLDVNLPASLSPDDRRRLEHAGHSCPVHRSLHPDVDVKITFRFEAQPSAS